VRDGKVVKGVRFRDHEIVGDILELAERYCDAGADELVFYDITASPDGRTVDRTWVTRVAELLNIPFSVAGGIRSLADAEDVLNRGADKVSINSPALHRPKLIDELARRFGAQCVVLGVDSHEHEGSYFVYQNTGSAEKTVDTGKTTVEWITEAIQRGVGEVVLNCMNQDGVRQGYDCRQLLLVREECPVPLIASGGAGESQHFVDVFKQTDVDGALAASVFHKSLISIPELKQTLHNHNVDVRL
jgi:cyclase